MITIFSYIGLLSLFLIATLAIYLGIRPVLF